MPDLVRIKITTGAKTLELEGPLDWIESYEVDVSFMLQSLRESQVVPGRAMSASAAATPLTEASQDEAPEDFGELLLSMPRGASATDQILLAGWFAQNNSTDNTFTTRVANSLLVEQGVKVGNPSQCMANNLKAKRVFKVGSAYRVARPGVEYLSEVRAKGLTNDK